MGFIFFVIFFQDNLLLFSNNLFLLFELFSLFLFLLIIFCVLEAPLNVNEICSFVCLGKIIFVDLFELFLLNVLHIFKLTVLDVNFCVGLLNPLFLILD